MPSLARQASLLAAVGVPRWTRMATSSSPSPTPWVTSSERSAAALP